VNELIERVGRIERPAALKALLAWVDRGVLREENDDADMQRFRLLESAPTDVGAIPVGMTTAGSRVALTEEHPAVLTVQQQQAEQMKVYWKVRFLGFRNVYFILCAWLQFIEGMLTNLGGLPLDRIQTMLKFAPGYDRTPDQLGAFMDAARREGLVNVKDGVWRLNR
jgi:anaphase-promoting complex subunit 2